MKTITRFSTLMVLLLLAGTVFAQQALDRATVNRWADSMLEIQRWADTQPDSLFDDDFNETDPFDFEGSLARSVQQYGEVRRIINRHGFSNGDQWASVGSRIMNAYFAIEMERESPEMNREMQEALREIDSSPHLTPEQKAMMRAQIQQGMQMVEQMSNAPPADIAAVRANKAKLDQVFDDDDY